MPTPNCEELSNSASAKPSYFFSIFSFIYFLFSSCYFFLSLFSFLFFLFSFFSSQKNAEFTVFNIWKASEAPSEKV